MRREAPRTRSPEEEHKRWSETSLVKQLETVVATREAPVRTEKRPSRHSLCVGTDGALRGRMEHFTPLQSTLGGVIIGIATSLILVMNGRIAGISGITGGILKLQRGDFAWRALFVLGLLSGGLVYSLIWPQAFAVSIVRSPIALVVAGLLVGVGTQMGNGCTSGHGICGLSRVSARSMVAVATFMTTATITVALTHLLGVAQ